MHHLYLCVNVCDLGCGRFSDLPVCILSQYNGINLRNATEQQARLVIGQQCDTITIMAQYNPHMYQLGNHSRSRYTS